MYISNARVLTRVGCSGIICFFFYLKLCIPIKVRVGPFVVFVTPRYNTAHSQSKAINTYNCNNIQRNKNKLETSYV